MAYWRYVDGDVPALSALAVAGPQKAALVGAVDLGLPGVLVFLASTLVLIVVERRLGQSLPRPVRIGTLVLAFVLLTPFVGYEITDTPLRASGGLEVGIVTLRDLTGDAQVVAEGRDPMIGAIVMPDRCDRKRPKTRPRDARPYKGGDQFVCAGYFVGQQDGYIVLGGQDRLHYFSAQDVIRLDVIGPGESNYGLPEELGPYSPRP